MMMEQKLITQFDVLHDYAVHQVADHVEVKDAEDNCALHCGGQVLLSFDGWLRGLLSQELLHCLGFA